MVYVVCSMDFLFPYYISHTTYPILPTTINDPKILLNPNVHYDGDLRRRFRVRTFYD